MGALKRMNCCLKFPVLIAMLLISMSCQALSQEQKHNDLDALWNRYTYTYIDDGRVVSLDEDHITTSEGQSYAMLRAVWSDDHDTFRSVWEWTQQHLARPDNLFSWKWKNRVLDRNAATDADTDIALALLLAAERFGRSEYRHQALQIMDSIWKHEVLEWKGRYYLTGGNWAPDETYPTIHVGYLAPYAYELFSEVDDRHPWEELIRSSYDILEWIYFDQNLPLPPEKIYLDKENSQFLLKKPGQNASPRFSYDVFPIFWRVATDEQWFGRGKSELRQRMLTFFEQEWDRKQKFLDQYTLEGEPQSRLEGLPLYATVHSLARVNGSRITGPLDAEKVLPLWDKALRDKDTPYYLHNWLWFDRALELNTARTFSEFLAFLYPFDVNSFRLHFPAVELGLFLGLIVLFKLSPMRFKTPLKTAAMLLGLYLCGRYLFWRMQHSLNFIEAAGPYISIALLAAELYCFITVLLLLLQVGIRPVPAKQRGVFDESFNPTVDVMIPIYSESLEILESTLMGAAMMHYQNKKIHVCDDSHRDSVREMAERFGCHYIRGPKKHAKAGNINNALQQTDGELVLIFDTDHIPVVTFLDETVPLLAEEDVGFVQTAHHFYNRDIFQNSLRTPDAVSDEQDFFHHGIQAARDKWGGSFFVGTGAVFRRKALEDVGGLLLMSITEDIHTSQHLHARGWKSHYVPKNLAVGLNAENLSSYVGQRTRWMQGCLQVFFKDNPLFLKGLPWRHRLGYFASQYYFLFPVARLIFVLAPLCYLFFHWHPIFANFSALLAYLIPFLICLPVLSQLLVPGWPRVIWASAYENTVSAPLFWGIIAMILPKKLAFKVTPKGVNRDASRFDFQSAKYSILLIGITLVGTVKGLLELFYFQIEKEAYVFNLSWAFINLLLLLTPMVIAREHPRYRYQNRIPKALPVSVKGESFSANGVTHDVDMTGFSMPHDRDEVIPEQVEVCLGDEDSITTLATFCFHDRNEQGLKRMAFDFHPLEEGQRQWILRQVHCDPETWVASMTRRSRSNLVTVFHFFNGLRKSLRRPQELRRRHPRSAVLRMARCSVGGIMRHTVIVNRSLTGMGVYVAGRLPEGDTLSIEVYRGKTALPTQEYRIIHRKRSLFPGLHRIGLEKQQP